jgi:hypothetical protein
MKLEQKQWKGDWIPSRQSNLGDKADLLLVFGDTELLKSGKQLEELRAIYPKAHQFGCSTSGEIFEASISDDTLSTVAIQFEKTRIAHAQIHLSTVKSSFEAGEKLARELRHEGLTHVLVLTVGIDVNGEKLVKGLSSVLPSSVSITGGLAGDKERFKETFVISDGAPQNDLVAVVGLYGDAIKVGYASLGGWDPFGPERLITKSNGNVLYELDGKSALELYKSYLGKHAAELPASAQYFPLSLSLKEGDPGIVRTILTVDEKAQSMTAAADLPEGGRVRMMKTNLDRLILGARGAAERATMMKPQLALLISCVGRRMVLKQRAEEEVEQAREVFGNDAILTGFYSYGEISPLTPNAKCELHNQTMTITTLSEVLD